MNVDSTQIVVVYRASTDRTICQLPTDAEYLAREIASWLVLQRDLTEPLRNFFIAASQLGGIDGFGIILKRKPRYLPVLSISAFTDLSEDRIRSASSPRSLVADQFAVLKRAIKSEVFDDLVLELRYVDSRPSEVLRIAETFPDGLVDPLRSPLEH